MTGNSALVLFSGGLDSATSLYWAKTKFDSVSALSFNYHGRLEQEKRAFESVTERAGVKERIIVDLPFLKEAADAAGEMGIGTDSRWSSYVPARNMIFYSIAGHFAERSRIPAIIGGHSLDDAEFFRDSSPEFMEGLNSLFGRSCLTCSSDWTFQIMLPFASIRRGGIVKLALELGVPVDLTWSCHNDVEVHCGKCFACQERSRAFGELGIADPALRVRYRSC